MTELAFEKIQPFVFKISQNSLNGSEKLFYNIKHPQGGKDIIIKAYAQEMSSRMMEREKHGQLIVQSI